MDKTFSIDVKTTIPTPVTTINITMPVDMFRAIQRIIGSTGSGDDEDILANHFDNYEEMTQLVQQFHNAAHKTVRELDGKQ